MSAYLMSRQYLFIKWVRTWVRTRQYQALTVLFSLFFPHFVAGTHHTVMDVQRTDWIIADWNSEASWTFSAGTVHHRGCSTLHLFANSWPSLMSPMTIICRYHSFTRWVLWGLVIFVQGEEQRGEGASLLILQVLDVILSSFWICQKVCSSQTIWSAGLLLLMNTELKSTNRTLTYVPGQLGCWWM